MAPSTHMSLQSTCAIQTAVDHKQRADVLPKGQRLRLLPIPLLNTTGKGMVIYQEGICQCQQATGK